MSEHNHSHGHEVHTADAAHGAPVEIKHPPAPKSLMKEFRFSFKKQTTKDELGQEIKRPPVVLSVPVPTFEGMLESLTDTKVQQFVLDLLEEAVKDQVRIQVGDEEKPVNRQEDLDLSKLDLVYIANMPKSERTGGGISEEVWKAFQEDYITTMVTHSGKEKEKVERASNLLVKKFQPVRTEKSVLTFLRSQLAFWASHTSNLDDFAEVYKFLDDRAGMLLNKDSADLLQSL